MHRTHLSIGDISILLILSLIHTPCHTTAYDPRTLASKFAFDFESLTNFMPGNSSLPKASSARGVIESLLVPSHQRLNKKQEEECSVGDFQCSDPYCCPIGSQCCGLPPTACCSNPLWCPGIEEFPCCREPSNTCGGRACCEAESVCCDASPVGCCAASAVCCQSTTNPCCPTGERCCGDSCCPSGTFCERNECIDEALENNVIRFEYDEKKNGNLLRSMCNGLRGKNTQKLTYSGPADTKSLKKAKAKKRLNAGCKRGLCKQAKFNNNNPALNACDEYPPASSDEGGGTTVFQVVTCIPSLQNNYQGGIMSGVQRKLSKGDNFVISVDCDKVLGSINTSPRDVAVEEESPPTSGHDDQLSDLVAQLETQKTTSEANNGTVLGFISAKEMGRNSTAYGYYIAPFGDLWAGAYAATIYCASDSSFGGFMIDNDGDNITDSAGGADNTIFTIPPLTAGQNATISFMLDYPVGGVGMLIGVHGNATRTGGPFTWNLQGTTWDNVTDDSLDSDDGVASVGASSPATAGGSSSTGATGPGSGSVIVEITPLGMLIELVFVLLSTVM
ncbi:hypothetical protein B0H16DRAFT_1592685 [Mycena metata]|uniref:Deoxyribonuclease NucA/NucB domain-containing protein n=1 Tax=Mycena metata TaxID=1033252 RepID=A0AAD7HR26_9AGAR|nr:hypothetical protein B0H16DRAFT_1592685 [Mycena metata]